MTSKTIITKDLVKKKIHVTRAFDAPVEKVWQAWTESSELDKWWAPKPWRNETILMDFKEGGLWLYTMVGPENEKHYSRVEFGSILPQQSFSYTCSFCNEQGISNENSPRMYWHLRFFATATGSKVEVDLSFDNEDSMQKMVAMGFEGGFTMGLNNLDELLKA